MKVQKRHRSRYHAFVPENPTVAEARGDFEPAPSPDRRETNPVLDVDLPILRVMNDEKRR